MLFIFQNVNAQCSPDVASPVADILSLPDLIDECSVLLTAPIATDNCVGRIQGTNNDPLVYNEEETYTVTWVYDDGNGNTSIQTQNVIIYDITAPVVDFITLPDLIDECSITVLTSPTAADNCSGALTGATINPFSYNSQGTYVITWTYDDGNGNIPLQTQNVIVESFDTTVILNSDILTAIMFRKDLLINGLTVKTVML